MTKHKSPQDLMAARNPFERRPIVPVDIYSPPAQVEVNEPVVTPKPVSSNAKDERATPKESVPPPAVQKKDDTAKAYSTYLYSSQIKGIKLRAIEHEVNDFAIVQEAIDEYFQKHPL